MIPKPFRILAGGLARRAAGAEMEARGGPERSPWRKRCVVTRRRRYAVVAKLDPAKVKWMAGGVEKGARSAGIAARMGVPPRRARQIRARYRGTGEVPAPGVRGRTRKEIQDRARIPAEAFLQRRTGASKPGRIVAVTARIRIPHNTIHRVLKKWMAAGHPKKSRRRERIRYERTHSNSPWHADYELLPGGRWFMAHRDDASGFIAGYGAFDEDAGKRALEVLEKATAEHGRPATMMADRGSQFYASESEARKRGRAESGKRLDELGVRHILAWAGHPRTDGRPEGFRGGIRRKIERFSGIGEFVQRYNRDRPHDSLDRARRGRPPGRSRGRCPKRGKQSKTSTPGRSILLARMRNDFGIAHRLTQTPKIKCGQDLHRAWNRQQDRPSMGRSTSKRWAGRSTSKRWAGRSTSKRWTG